MENAGFVMTQLKLSQPPSVQTDKFVQVGLTVTVTGLKFDCDYKNDAKPMKRARNYCKK